MSCNTRSFSVLFPKSVTTSHTGRGGGGVIEDGRSAGTQALFQMVGLALAISVALIMGMTTGKEK